ncbi:MAG: NAD-dependent epimerase/dehydratase family protein, partial [Methanomicrobia archaeon]|nr:NAD-dependent epimerase/dehydratase family protein [Methanomicrobia archaeon]
MNVLVTGANGFIGKNLCLELKNQGYTILPFDVDKSDKDLADNILAADFIIHLAGVNRPLNNKEFYDGNTNFTKKLIDFILLNGKKIPLIFSSSTQAELDNDYGKSKKMAEEFLFDFMDKQDNPVIIYRLTNVFGKWCKPNYNSVVATFCHNIANDLPIEIRDENYILKLVYIDDVVKEFIHCLSETKSLNNKKIREVQPAYSLSLGELANKLLSFKKTRETFFVPDIKTDFDRKLYSTYISYYGADDFAYDFKMNVDDRGSFTELLKTFADGQVSVNVSKPGITKGNHYHHTKNEKFIVVSGECEIKFRKIGTEDVISYR